jgi:hypothetical protein
MNNGELNMKLRIGNVEITLDSNQQSVEYIEALVKTLQGSVQGSTQILSSQEKDYLVVLEAAGISVHTATIVFNHAFDEKLNAKKLPEKIKELSLKTVEHLKRPLKETYWGVLIAPGHRGLVASGVNSDNKMSILGLTEGNPRDPSTISNLVKELKSRGLRGVDIFIISGPKALREAVAKVYPASRLGADWSYVIHQAGLEVPLARRASFLEQLKEIQYAQSKSAAIKLLKNIKKEPKAVEIIEHELGALTEYLHFPEKVWRALRTTKVLTRMDQEVTNKLRKAEKFHAEEFLINFICLRLEYHWNKIPIDSTSLSNLKYLKMRPIRHHK